MMWTSSEERAVVRPQGQLILILSFKDNTLEADKKDKGDIIFGASFNCCCTLIPNCPTAARQHQQRPIAWRVSGEELMSPIRTERLLRAKVIHGFLLPCHGTKTTIHPPQYELCLAHCMSATMDGRRRPGQVVCITHNKKGIVST